MACNDCKDEIIDVYLRPTPEQVGSDKFRKLLKSELISAYEMSEVQANILLEKLSTKDLLIYSGTENIAVMNIHRFAINGIYSYGKSGRLRK